MKLRISEYVLQMVEAFSSEIQTDPKTHKEVEEVVRKTETLSHIVASQLVQEAIERRRSMHQAMWYTRVMQHGIARHNIKVEDEVVTWESYEGMPGMVVLADIPSPVGTPLVRVHSYGFKKVDGPVVWDRDSEAWVVLGGIPKDTNEVDLKD